LSVLAAYCPAAHVTVVDPHDDAPEAEVLPESQAMHAVAPAVENHPAKHFEHSLELSVEYMPAAQLVHLMELESVVETKVPYCPAAHTTISVWEHDVEPELVAVEQ